MTESQQPQKRAAKKAAAPGRRSTSAHRKVLEGAFSPAVVDAIDGRIREVSLETIGEVKQELVDVVEQQKRTVAEIDAMPPSPERDQAAAAAKEASAEVKVAGAEVNEVLAQERAGQPVAPEQVQQAGESVERAKEKVDQASEETSRQLASLREQGDRHQAILAVDHDGERPPSRLDQIERDVADLKSWRSSANQRIEGAQSTASRAVSMAQAAASSGNALKRASTWALGTFGVVFILYLLIWGTTDLDWRIRDQFAWPFGLAAVAFWLGVITAKASQSESSATAEASSHDSRKKGDAGLDIVREEEHDQQRSHGASARSDATASSR